MPEPGSYNSQLISSLLSGSGAVSKGTFGGLLPDADTAGGFKMQTCAIVGANPLNTPFSALVASGRIGAKPGKQALLAKLAAQVSSDFAKANQDGQAYKQMLAADVQQAAISHGLPRDLKGGNDTGGRSA